MMRGLISDGPISARLLFLTGVFLACCCHRQHFCAVPEMTNLSSDGEVQSDSWKDFSGDHLCLFRNNITAAIPALCRDPFLKAVANAGLKFQGSST
jgi:hypothetical protein